MPELKSIKFELKGEFIELIKLLKAVNLCQSGGEAKVCVENREVKVDDEIELRKRRKIRKGCKVDFKNHQINIV